MKQAYKFSRSAAFRKLIQSNREFTQIFEHGTLEIELFKPNGTDTQQPHQKDEVYIIISGEATFWHEGNFMSAEAGDCIFVPAYDEHCFANSRMIFQHGLFSLDPKEERKNL